MSIELIAEALALFSQISLSEMDNVRLIISIRKEQEQGLN
jgi:hypothetical protein